MKKSVKLSVGTEFFCIIGVHPHERAEKQKIVFYAECEYITPPQREEIICYVAVRDEVERLLETEKFFYLEEAVDFISDKLLQKYPFSFVFVRISKAEALENTIFSVESCIVREE